MTFSIKQYYERMGAGRSGDTLRTNQPMDAGYTWTLVDNIAHLIDVSPKYRMNWLHLDNDIANQLLGNKAFYFFTQITENGRYPRFDVRIAAGLGNAEVEMRASLVTPITNGPIYSSTDQGVLGSWVGETPSGGNADWIIEQQTGEIDTNRCPIFDVPAAKFVTGDVSIGRFGLLKLLVEYDYETGEGGPNAVICGVQVREYLVGG